MSILEKLGFRQSSEATTKEAIAGAPITRFNQPYHYIQRPITPDLIAEDRCIPVVLSSLVGLSRLCFGALDFDLTPADPSDDTQGKRIAQALTHIRQTDKKIGRVGKMRRLGTVGLVRAAALDGWSFRQSVAEYARVQEGGWLNFSEIQHLPGRSFGSGPGITGNDMILDEVLPGIVYDSTQDATRFFQTKIGTGWGGAVELNPEQILYIEDVCVPSDTSFLKALIGTSIEPWKEIRRYGMTAERRIAVPNEVASIDAKDIAALIGQKVKVDMQELINYCEDMVKNQSHAERKVSLAGMKLSYPNISMPLDPWQADAYLKKEIIDFFFHREITEQLAQAISVSGAPALEVLDIHIASERELWGCPYEQLWTEQFLEPNGFGDLVLAFDWWNWTPKDIVKERSHQLMALNAGSILINDFRKMNGWPEYDEKQLAQLKEERNAIHPVGKGSQGGQV